MSKFFNQKRVVNPYARKREISCAVLDFGEDIYGRTRLPTFPTAPSAAKLTLEPKKTNLKSAQMEQNLDGNGMKSAKNTPITTQITPKKGSKRAIVTPIRTSERISQKARQMRRMNVRTNRR